MVGDGRMAGVVWLNVVIKAPGSLVRHVRFTAQRCAFARTGVNPRPRKTIYRWPRAPILRHFSS
jgi:hypothetical protein